MIEEIIKQIEEITGEEIGETFAVRKTKTDRQFRCLVVGLLSDEFTNEQIFTALKMTAASVSQHKQDFKKYMEMNFYFKQEYQQTKKQLNYDSKGD